MPSRQKLAPPPDPAVIKATRLRYGHTQDTAGALVCATRRTWQTWEAGTPMPPGLWELYLMTMWLLEEGLTEQYFSQRLSTPC